MKEVIMRLTSDHIKVKNGEYVQDLVRCKDCKKHNTHRCHMAFDLVATDADDFCSYGERVTDE